MCNEERQGHTLHRVFEKGNTSVAEGIRGAQHELLILNVVWAMHHLLDCSTCPTHCELANSATFLGVSCSWELATRYKHSKKKTMAAQDKRHAELSRAW